MCLLRLEVNAVDSTVSQVTDSVLLLEEASVIEQIMKLFVMQLSRIYCHFISFTSKYSPNHFVLKHCQSVSFP
jgi:hypothetical protein